MQVLSQFIESLSNFIENKIGTEKTLLLMILIAFYLCFFIIILMFYLI
jgi:hypothetical protein